MTWTVWKLMVRRHLAAFMITLVGISFLIYCLSLAEFARRAAKADQPFTVALEFASLQTPGLVLQVLPLVFLIAAIWAFAQLSRSNVLLVARTTGFTPTHTLLPAITVALLVSAVFITVVNPISARLAHRLERLEAVQFRGVSSLLTVSRNGVWLRQADLQGQSVIHARSANNTGTVLSDVNIFSFDASGTLVQQLAAAQATLADRQWILRNATIHDIESGGPQSLPPAVRKDTHAISTHLTPDRILDSLSPPDAIQIWKLPNIIADLQNSGFDARRHRAHLHVVLALPAVLIGMAVIATIASVQLRNLRQRIVRYSAALLGGLGFFFAMYVMETVAISGGVPVPIAIWGAAAAGVLAAMAASLHWEPG